ncbi:hypothetical protein [Neptunomonas phycophila]|uniref:hypothetical protein n=1 Tax=Neptunomonas phycophila TaxID=1572645 RepID=UPI0009490C3C|nr:hypothetical protein [Neptunomonas phycophila]
MIKQISLISTIILALISAPLHAHDSAKVFALDILKKKSDTPVSQDGCLDLSEDIKPTLKQIFDHRLSEYFSDEAPLVIYQKCAGQGDHKGWACSITFNTLNPEEKTDGESPSTMSFWVTSALEIDPDYPVTCF